jgi:hypothetical protein
LLLALALVAANLGGGEDRLGSECGQRLARAVFEERLV